MSDTRVVDARALRCPQPVIELARAARSAAPGDLVAVWWTDPAAEHDIPAWARMRGHELIGTAPLPEDAPDANTHADTHVPVRAAFVTTVRIGQP